MKEYDVVGIGSALMDLLVKVDAEVLEELGLEKGTMSLIDKKHSKRVMEKLKNFKIAPGGSSANTVAGIALLGGRAVFCGKVGNDIRGEVYSNRMLYDGAEPAISRDKKESTGHAITFITPDNERTFATHLGASTRLGMEDIPGEKISSSRILHIEGYQLEDPALKKASLYAMKIAKSSGTLVSVDLADPNLVKRNLRDFKAVVRDYVDIVFANEDEAKEFTGKEKPEEALKEIGMMCAIAIVKTGKKGSLAMKAGKIHRIPPFRAKAVDTTGAGDIYAAGVLWGLSRKIPIEKSCRLGSMLAAKVVEMVGARIGRGHAREILARLSISP
jgi:sugar/nucleoside kinase (ribokinase family)